MRITRKIFNDLAIWMIGFGIIVGIIFPFFARAFGVQSEIAYSPRFLRLPVSKTQKVFLIIQ